MKIYIDKKRKESKKKTERQKECQRDKKKIWMKF